jgi:hypothetical protein
MIYSILIVPFTVVGLGLLKNWDPGFESRSGEGYRLVFVCFVLSYADRHLAMGCPHPPPQDF